MALGQVILMAGEAAPGLLWSRIRSSVEATTLATTDEIKSPRQNYKLT
jgi:hypothetical protein